MTALATYLASKHYRLRGGPPPGPKMDAVAAQRLNILAERMEKANDALAHANVARGKISDYLHGKRALVKLQDGQKNPTEVKILSVEVTIRAGSTGGADHYIELWIELIHSEPHARLRRRTIPLNLLVEVLE